MEAMDTLTSNGLAELKWCIAQSKAPHLRTMRQFAEEEVILPEGPFRGQRFRCSRQPYTALWFDQVDSGHWSRFVATGPTQSGKTLSCFVIPLLYHLFEVGETVICGLPDMDMAADKWREDILPVIEQSRYRNLLPRQGGGSRGGKVESILFTNGATLKFMSGGGGDKSRAGFTSRVVVITETDGLDQSGPTSRESDKITQLEARTKAYGSRKRIYMECTVSTEQGRTWREYQQGTKSTIVLPCPHCRAWVSPEREHLVHWQGAESKAQAARIGAFSCPNCGEVWSEDDRLGTNRQCKLVHDGQTIDEQGNVQGNLPETDTLGFRWSAANNLFLTAGYVAAEEWRASRSPDEDNSEREMRQFVWCLPTVPLKWNQTGVEASALTTRVSKLPKGLAPQFTKFITVGLDIGKFLAHWIAVAWCEGATGSVIDYGRIEVPSADLGVEQAVMVALREFKDLVLAGWTIEGRENEQAVPNQVWIDAGYMTPVVYEFCRKAADKRFLPCVGRGANQQRQQIYNRPTQLTQTTRFIGRDFHINYLQAERINLVEINADYWKTWVHQRLTQPLDKPGAMTFYHAPPEMHLSIAKHLTAEAKTEEFVAGKGVIVKWECIRRSNHFFDALYYAAAAGWYCGVRLEDEPPARLKRPTRTLEEMAQAARSRNVQ
jgi:phage terminase large subunit GpA-like protein